MRKKSNRLWEQAQEDLDTAAKLLEIGKYYASVFFSEQAAEKALKVIYLEKRRRMTFTLDLVELAEVLGAPEDILYAAAELSHDYILTRYPDAANAMPAKLYNASSAEMHLKLSREVIQWAKKELRLET
jgi:HEPN domain-containing protein